MNLDRIIQRVRLGLRRQRPVEVVATATLHLGGQSLAGHCEQVLGLAPVAAWRLGGRNNSLSLRVLADGRLFKVFECASVAQAGAVASALEHLHAAGVAAPRLHGVSGHVVFADWIEGVPGKALSRSELARRMPQALARLHQVRPEIEASAMPHVQWLLERLQQLAVAHAGEQRVLAAVETLRARAPTSSPLAVIHPDFIPANLVLTRDEALVPVDNEFLGVGQGMELDVLNAADALYRRRPRARERFIERWLTRVDDATLISHRAWWEALLQVQRIGGAFSRGKTGQGVRRFAQLEHGLKYLP